MQLRLVTVMFFCGFGSRALTRDGKGMKKRQHADTQSLDPVGGTHADRVVVPWYSSCSGCLLYTANKEAELLHIGKEGGEVIICS